MMLKNIESEIDRCGKHPQYHQLSPEVIEGLHRYVRLRIPTGSFLQAVLSNDLKEACMCADLKNQRTLFGIVNYVYNECPMVCWGSPEKVANWLSLPASEKGSQ